MATTTAPAHPAADPLGLAGAKLPRWTPAAAAVGAIAVTAGLFALTPMQGAAQFALLSVLLFVLLQSAASFAVEGRRRAVDRFFTTLVYGAFGLALLPLLSVAYTVVSRGAGVVSAEFLTHSLRNIGPKDAGGGIYHGMIGTLEQAAITSLISIPIALLVAVYLVEYGRGRLARVVTFFVDVMTGIPSIVAGLFLFTVWVLMLGLHRAGFPAALALAILMIPTVVRSTEEMLKLVPDELREASLALGVPKWRTVLRVVLPTALPGIVTGVMLGIARVIGETAPLLLLVGATDSINPDPFNGPQTALPMIIFDQAARPQDAAVARAWGAALVLIVIVMLLNLIARTVARFTRVR
ncbi:MAG TPA: phosphate ABC transporter permease PstA [Kineosporiaceae bacterium]|nr:phosphate ABC transporter permease PstA [Kineosporiaceae bacterium]